MREAFWALQHRARPEVSPALPERPCRVHQARAARERELYPNTYPAACPDTVRPAFRMTYATNDAYPPQMFADTIEWHRTEQSCSSDPMPTEPAPCVAYQDCDQPVVACEYEGLGHAWPSDWTEGEPVPRLMPASACARPAREAETHTRSRAAKGEPGPSSQTRDP
jgi:hypothetical protein